MTEKDTPSQATPKAKKLAHELIPKDSDAGARMYKLAAELVADHHDDAKDARIALAWNLSWKPDVDGRQQLGKCKLATDLDRELYAFDVVVILNKAFWTDVEVNDTQRAAVLDHQLSHVALQRATNLEPIEDEKGRKCYRLRKHDIEEFSAVVGRHGLYMKDLERFAVQIRRARQRDLFDRDDEEEEGTPSSVGREEYDEVAETDGVVSGSMNPPDADPADAVVLHGPNAEPVELDDQADDDEPRKYPAAVEERLRASGQADK